MSNTLISSTKVNESPEVKEYALSREFFAETKTNYLKTSIDIFARIALFYVLASLGVQFAIYVWRLLTCNC